MKIGIDIGGSHICVGIIEDDKIIALKEKNYSKEDKYDFEKTILESIDIFIKELLEENKLEFSRIELIGIASPGLISNGIIKRARNLNLNEFNIVKILENKYNKKIILKNDAKAASLAEKKYGSLENFNDCVFLSIGTGIGGAVYINGKLLRANKFEGFEFGHMVLNPNGKECKCGSRGCFETYASINAFKKKVTQDLKMDDDITGQYLRENILIKNDSIIQNDIKEFLNYLKIGICNLINIFEPEVVCLGGSFSYYEGNPIYDRLIEKINMPSSTFNGEVPKIVLAKFKNNAGIIGATIEE